MNFLPQTSSFPPRTRFGTPLSLMILRFSAPMRFEIFLFRILFMSALLNRLFVLASVKSEIHRCYCSTVLSESIFGGYTVEQL